MVALLMRPVRFFLVPQRTSRNVTWVCDDGLYKASVAYEDRKEENVVNDEYDSGGPGSTRDQHIIGWIEQVVNCEKRVSESTCSRRRIAYGKHAG
jgi:hypothetical protein